jgi:hypothetical protein
VSVSLWTIFPIPTVWHSVSEQHNYTFTFLNRPHNWSFRMWNVKHCTFWHDLCVFIASFAVIRFQYRQVGENCLIRPFFLNKSVKCSIWNTEWTAYTLQICSLPFPIPWLFIHGRPKGPHATIYVYSVVINCSLRSLNKTTLKTASGWSCRPEWNVRRVFRTTVLRKTDELRTEQDYI